MKRTRRISDQVLVLRAITCVREELAACAVNNHGDIAMAEIMGRLTSLYACLDSDRIAAALALADTRSKHYDENK